MSVGYLLTNIMASLSGVPGLGHRNEKPVAVLSDTKAFWRNRVHSLAESRAYVKHVLCRMYTTHLLHYSVLQNSGSNISYGTATGKP